MDPNNNAPNVTPSPYVFDSTFTSQRPSVSGFGRSTSRRTLAMLLNNPSRFTIIRLFIYEKHCQIIAHYWASGRHNRRRHNYNLYICRADVVDPLIWNSWTSNTGKEFLIELFDDHGLRRQLLQGKEKRVHPWVTVDKRYYLSMPHSINKHAVVIFTCKELPGVQFKLDKTLDAAPPFYTLYSMDNQIISVYNRDYWSGLREGKCISWHAAFSIARIYAVDYWRKANAKTP